MSGEVNGQEVNGCFWEREWEQEHTKPRGKGWSESKNIPNHEEKGESEKESF